MKTYTVDELFSEIPDDPGNVILTFPPEIIEQVGWKEGDLLKFKIENGSIIISNPSVYSGS